MALFIYIPVIKFRKSSGGRETKAEEERKSEGWSGISPSYSSNEADKGYRLCIIDPL